MEITKEQWIQLNRPFHYYFISNLGRIKNDRDHILKTTQTTCDFPKVTLVNSETKKRKVMYLHRLIAEYFVPRTDPTQIRVNHINGNKKDNRVNNLEWLTISDQIKRRNANKPPKIICQIDDNNAIIKEWISVKKCADEISISRKSIYNLLAKKTDKVKGYKLIYKDGLQTDTLADSLELLNIDE